MTRNPPGYGRLTLFVINSANLLIVGFSLAKPTVRRDGHRLSALSACIVAVFVETYSVSLTIYLLSDWLGRRYPALDLMSHDAGQLWSTLFDWTGDLHLDPLQLLGNVLILGGFLLLAAAWGYPVRRVAGGAATTSWPLPSW